jgi:hypothetical protein
LSLFGSFYHTKLKKKFFLLQKTLFRFTPAELRVHLGVILPKFGQAQFSAVIRQQHTIFHLKLHFSNLKQGLRSHNFLCGSGSGSSGKIANLCDSFPLAYVVQSSKTIFRLKLNFFKFKQGLRSYNFFYMALVPAPVPKMQIYAALTPSLWLM